MEIETMFTEQKWNILKCLAIEHLSPLQLSQRLNTTMANVSQQLKLLEAVNLVKKSKIKNRDKGKPRTLFSLTQDHALLIPTMNGFAAKKLLQVGDHHRIVLRIWFVQNKEMHCELEELYFKIRPRLQDIKAFFVDETDNVVYIGSDHLTQEDLQKHTPLRLNVLSLKKLSKQLPKLTDHTVAVLYDPQKLISSSPSGIER